jgi:hypothetical protein
MLRDHLVTGRCLCASQLQLLPNQARNRALRPPPEGGQTRQFSHPQTIRIMARINVTSMMIIMLRSERPWGSLNKKPNDGRRGQRWMGRRGRNIEGRVKVVVWQPWSEGGRDITVPDDAMSLECEMSGLDGFGWYEWSSGYGVTVCANRW